MTVEPTKSDAGKNFDQLICESCGESFPCGADVGKCWCFSFELRTETLTKLRENYQNCLCGDCLKSAANRADEMKQAG